MALGWMRVILLALRTKNASSVFATECTPFFFVSRIETTIRRSLIIFPSFLCSEWEDYFVG